MNVQTALISSIVYDSFLISFMIWGFLNTTRNAYDRCYSFLFVPLLVFSFLAFTKFRDENWKIKTALVGINTFTYLFLIILVVFRASWDLDFFTNYKDFSSMVELIHEKHINSTSDNDISVELPEQYGHLAQNREIYLSKDLDNNGLLVIFPNTSIDLDGYLTAYVYASGIEPNQIPKKCISGREVNPSKDNWYYCVLRVNKIYSFQND